MSTAKQGEHGVSLQEQRDAIIKHCKTNSIEIIQWFEERETAAKKGRPVFGKMLKLLRQGKAEGVVIHKIDRSARNLKDWANLGDLIDQGIDVRFANESLDLTSRGGRLSADIQAVVAADYIRNLREETRKGFYGRLKQGLYPLPAPIGYVNNGKAQPKSPCPVTAPLVKKAFELYASGKYSLETLRDEMDRLGMRSRNGGKVSLNRLSIMLNNPFYIGLIRLRRTEETFTGVHTPLISKRLFDTVQAILSGKTRSRGYRHEFLFQRLLRCKNCNYSLIGETQKGHIYYRCQNKNCPTTCVREEAVEEVVKKVFAPLQFSLEEKECVQTELDVFKNNWENEREIQLNILKLQLARITDRLTRLTDAFLDATIEKDLFEERKKALFTSRLELEEKLRDLDSGGNIADRLKTFLELAGSMYLSYKFGVLGEKRDLVKTATSNRLVDGKNVDIKLSFLFQEVANRRENSNGGPYRDIPRTLKKMVANLYEYFKEEAITIEEK